jgi:hypothetical protein
MAPEKTLACFKISSDLKNLKNKGIEKKFCMKRAEVFFRTLCTVIARTMSVQMTYKTLYNTPKFNFKKCKN